MVKVLLVFVLVAVGIAIAGIGVTYFKPALLDMDINATPLPLPHIPPVPEVSPTVVPSSGDEILE
jgi:hypothetical protein